MKYKFIKYLGPGLIASASAIGTSHLVQSTQAGAQYGYQLVLAILMINLLKYPFFEFGSRYASATGENLIQGYARHNFKYIYIYVFTNFVICCVSISALSMFLSSLFCSTFSIPSVYLPFLSSLFITLNLFLLIKGKYKLLESSMKIMLVVLILCTILVAILTVNQESKIMDYSIIPIDLNHISLVFVVALFGWMPTLLEGGIWQSIWFQARDKVNQKRTPLKFALIDFNVGYISCALLAILFVYLGANVMYGMILDAKPVSFDKMSGIVFSGLFLDSYNRVLPFGIKYLANIGALAAIFSSLITVQDALSRSTQMATYLHKHRYNLNDKIENIPNKLCIKTLIYATVVTICIIFFFKNHFRLLLTIAMVMSFMMSPITAFMTHKVIFSKAFPKKYKPKLWLKILSITGLIFLSIFACFFIFTKLF